RALAYFSSLCFGRGADALLGHDRFETRDFLAQAANAAGVLQLSVGPLEAQIELLLLQLGQGAAELIRGLRAEILCGRRVLRALFLRHDVRPLERARNELGVDRELARTQAQRFLCRLVIDAVDLEQDAARLDLRHPIFRRALARAHAHFGRLLRHRHIREHADPDAAGALHLTRDRA